ncbi:transmembrane protein 39A isoform X1 [Scleropages formosus]|uniref:transmembrane protein 39A isoform X1 n=1 Tax=Scleropages formosus TaxID=113540 RepID=UPI000878C2C8|nr:uncharacterized protein LOC108931945 isoform X1 [Scleropages formosus]XP_018603550.1 uncharacterized protein LOC108931945 isoform X1 [Scleropages formosus]
MPVGRRGPSRQQLSRSALPSLQTLVGSSNGTGLRNRSSASVGVCAPPLTALITPEPVRHSRIPELPLDSSLLFELMLFLYLLVALFVQYINIYKTVWWYPYSHSAASTSLNFHLIDYHLVIFITVMLARRLVWTIISEASQQSSSSALRYLLLIAMRLTLLTLCGWLLCWTLVHLFSKHSIRCVRAPLLLPPGGPGAAPPLRQLLVPGAEGRWAAAPPPRLPEPVAREPAGAAVESRPRPPPHVPRFPGADPQRGGGPESRLQPAYQGGAFQLALQRLLRGLPAAVLRAEHAVFRHALVVRAPHHGLDQRVRHAHEPAAAPPLLRPAAPLGRTPGQVAEAGAWLLQQCAAAPLVRQYHLAPRGAGATQPLPLQGRGALQRGAALGRLPRQVLLPVPQATAHPEPAHRHRGERGALPAVLAAALQLLEQDALAGTRPLLQLLRALQAAARPHRAGQGLRAAPCRRRQDLGPQVTLKRRRWTQILFSYGSIFHAIVYIFKNRSFIFCIQFLP